MRKTVAHQALQVHWRVWGHLDWFVDPTKFWQMRSPYSKQGGWGHHAYRVGLSSPSFERHLRAFTYCFMLLLYF